MKLFVRNNYLYTETESFRCAIGLNGLTRNKHEGDCTPIGVFRFDKIYYRLDKLRLKNEIFNSVIIDIRK